MDLIIPTSWVCYKEKNHVKWVVVQCQTHTIGICVQTVGVVLFLLLDGCLWELSNGHATQSNSPIPHHWHIYQCQKYPTVLESVREFGHCLHFLGNCLLSLLLPWPSVISIAKTCIWPRLLQKSLPHGNTMDPKLEAAPKEGGPCKLDPKEAGGIYISLGISILLLWGFPS